MRRQQLLDAINRRQTAGNKSQNCFLALSPF